MLAVVAVLIVAIIASCSYGYAVRAQRNTARRERDEAIWKTERRESIMRSLNAQARGWRIEADARSLAAQIAISAAKNRRQ